MATWDSLPPEIHDHILRLFCQDIITAYNALGSTRNISRHKHWRHETRLQWPPAPSCLTHISSATRVCRFFYRSIVHRTASMEHLQLLQRETVCGIVQLFDPPLNSDDDDDYHGHVHVGMFMKLAGVFWKNPRILEDYELMTDVLQVLQKSSLLMLLPHLEEWTRRYAVPGNSNGGGCAVFNLRRDRARGVFHDATFRIGGSGSFFSVGDDCPDVKIFTIDGLSPLAIDDDWWEISLADRYDSRQIVRNILLQAKYPVLQLVEDSEPHTWWVFGLGHGMFEDRWFLVNFEQRIFWNCSMGGVICVWHEICMWSLDCWELVRAFDRHGPMREISDALLNYMTYGQKRIDGRGDGEQDQSTESDVDGDEDDDDEPESDGTSDIVDSSSAFETFSKAFG